MMKRLRNSPIFSSVRVGRCAMSTMCSFRSRVCYMTRAVGEMLSFSQGCRDSMSRHPMSVVACRDPAAARPARAETGASGPLCSRRVSDAAALRRAASVVRLRRHIVDRTHLEACGLQRTDRGLAARARALHEDVDLLDAVLLRL